MNTCEVGHDLHGEALVESASAAMTASGERWTPMRAKVFKALADFSRPASAYAIAEAVSRAEGRSVAANSVYRILDLFVSANVARRVESANAYVANTHPQFVQDCIFMICDECGAVDHVDDDRTARALRRAAGTIGFSTVRPVLEVRGRCRRCATTRHRE